MQVGVAYAIQRPVEAKVWVRRAKCAQLRVCNVPLTTRERRAKAHEAQAGDLRTGDDSVSLGPLRRAGAHVLQQTYGEGARICVSTERN